MSDETHIGTFLRHRHYDEGGRAQLARTFQNAEPFPHVVLRDFLSIEPPVLLESYPEPGWPGWGRFTDSYQKGKLHCGSIEIIPSPLCDVIHELSSPSFLNFLEEVTGIKRLLPDPYLHGGGLHCSGVGGILAPHTDFHLYRDLEVYRRLNVLLYLNPGWQEDYGGCLELFRRRDEEEPAKTVVPRWGTCVIFRTDDRSVHGFSKPITGAGRYRRSIATYYYTSREAGSFSGDEVTYWRQSRTSAGAQARLKLAAYKLLLSAGRAFSSAAYRYDPNRRPD